MSKTANSGPRPVLHDLKGYSVPRASAPVDLRLDGNEGPRPEPDLLKVLLQGEAEILRRYPDKSILEAKLAARLDVEPQQVIVTNGGDDAIDRVCRAYLSPQREIVVPHPGFSMIEQYARIVGGTIRRVPWTGTEFPVESYLEAINARTGVVAVISPNNPTGAVVTAADLARLAEAARHAVLLVDLAYVEFADEDPTSAVLQHSNAVVIRTFSKAWGLAGLRVGYAVGPRAVIDCMRATGGPYPVSAASLAIAQARLDDDVSPFIERVKVERQELVDHLRELDFKPLPSQGNFVFVDVEDGAWFRDAMAGMGIGVRAFAADGDQSSLRMERCVRITCPGDVTDHTRLVHAMRTLRRPQAFLLDLDGILADVSTSYREAIIQTAAHFGVAVTRADVAAIKAEGDANNDWIVTQRLLSRAGVDVALEDVTQCFERLYQGEPGRSGLREDERLIVAPTILEHLRRRAPLGIVTGRPRQDAERFLERFEIGHYFDVLVCMEDAPIKPNPAPLHLAMKQLEVEQVWFVGDTPDDMRAARAARALPIGCVAPGDERATVEPVLVQAGAARVFERLEGILSLPGFES